jgi:hypothetical protein
MAVAEEGGGGGHYDGVEAHCQERNNGNPVGHDVSPRIRAPPIGLLWATVLGLALHSANVRFSLQTYKQRDIFAIGGKPEGGHRIAMSPDSVSNRNGLLHWEIETV